MEYRNFVEGKETGTAKWVVPDLYNNVDPGYEKKLAKMKADVIAEGEANNKRKKSYLWILATCIFVPLAIVAMGVQLIFGLGFKYAVITLLAAVVIAITIAGPVAGFDSKKRKKTHEDAVEEYRRNRLQFKANEYLYGLLQFTKIKNIIMSNGEINVEYISSNDTLKHDTFKYEEWKGDEDLNTPFLVFEGSRLFGRSGNQAESTTFTTNIID